MLLQNILIKQGETWSLSLYLFDGVGNVLNLGGYTFTGYIKTSYATKALVEIHTTVDDVEAGTITLSLSTEETAMLKSGRYVYTIFREYVDNTITVILNGIVTVDATANVSGTG